ncbi:hypothetical protein [Alkalicoccus halolimnae]|uniref:Uncharacterized protein n=1 Tax=Alkalicoccus halolimnae TaxID=1667239 RepID=A0A5C7FK56_9BACI|nr:hypothetical protein [Alkalicoccus halolimnae]TXF85786.1 hypothetical protein FTX54_06830 [Alkalicoccus halolimnae]
MFKKGFSLLAGRCCSVFLPWPGVEMGRHQGHEGRAPPRTTAGRTGLAEAGPAPPWKRKRLFITYLLYFQGSLNKSKNEAETQPVEERRQNPGRPPVNLLHGRTETKSPAQIISEL